MKKINNQSGVEGYLVRKSSVQTPGAMATDGHAHRSNTSVDRTHGELTHSLFKKEKQINTFYSVS
jgi:hypothetical protein